ncbi:hypothetical protein I3842_06G125600 [Carya illinoinensis]|uniref:ER lumen protein retaining receptor n=1 Tax=Carya illinoinensis TaxID=32201 RepID=A0A922JHX2_CARIL|nr:hypothetical protein I3842_06G125600 [Carya illinoinensis]
MRAQRTSIHAVSTWVRRQPPKVKAFLAVVSGMAALVLLRFIVHDHDNLFVAAEAVHSIGISVLIYKLMKEKTCAGLSLKSQDLTAIFLAVRLYCSFVMEYDIHTLLDLATLATTLWVIYMIRFKLKSSYMEDKDNFAIYYVAVPCAVLALLIHPSTSHHFVNRIFWAFCVYLEAISVLPQLRVMQNTKVQFFYGSDVFEVFHMNRCYSLCNSFYFFTSRLLNHSLLIMCLLWVWQGS